MDQIDLNAARRSVEDQPNEIGEVSHEDLDTARRSVDILEGDPRRFNALAIVMQQPSALASQRAFVGRPNLFPSVGVSRRFPRGGTSVYRVGIPCHRGPGGRACGAANLSRAFLEAEGTHRRGIVCGKRCSFVGRCVD